MSLTTRILKPLAVVSLISITLSTKTLALEGTWQAGINAGVSFLSPDTGGSGFTLDDDRIDCGRRDTSDLTSRPSFPQSFAFTDLGEASLSGGQSIEYQAISLGATVYFLGRKTSPQTFGRTVRLWSARVQLYQQRFGYRSG